MTTVTVQEAGVHFQKLIEQVEKGEIVEITRDGRPVATISSAPAPKPERDPEAIKKAIDEWIAYRDEHNITLGSDITIRELMEEGRKY